MCYYGICKTYFVIVKHFFFHSTNEFVIFAPESQLMQRNDGEEKELFGNIRLTDFCIGIKIVSISRIYVYSQAWVNDLLRITTTCLQ
jgi:hypothetical protein